MTNSPSGSNGNNQFTITSESGGILKIILSLPNYCTAKINIQYENLKFANDKDDNQRINFNSEFSEFKEVEEFLHFIVSEFMTSKS